MRNNMITEHDAASNDLQSNPRKLSNREKCTRQHRENPSIPLKQKITEKNIASAQDRLEGSFMALKGHHPCERAARQSLAKPAPKTKRLAKRFSKTKIGKREHRKIIQQGFVLSGLAAHYDLEKLCRSVVINPYDHGSGLVILLT